MAARARTSGKRTGSKASKGAQAAKAKGAKAARKRGAKAARAAAPDPPEGEGGPRALWAGTVTFGLVSVPVELFPSSRDAGPRLRMLSESGRPLERRYRCPEHGSDVAWDEVARAEEDEDGLVVLTDDEVEAIAPRRSRDIEIDAFVDASEIDPTMTETAYVLTPGRGSTKPYRLLADAMEESGRAGLGTFVLRRRERLVAVTAEHGVLWALVLRFRGEMRTPEDVGLAGGREPDARARTAFRKALSGLADERWSPEALRDERAAALEALVERKRRRGEDVVSAPAGEDGEGPEEEEGGGSLAPDLLEAIRRRLAAGPGRAGSAGNGARKRAPKASGSKLASLSKEELYAKAQALELEGRSRMTKDELVAALSRR